MSKNNLLKITLLAFFAILNTSCFQDFEHTKIKTTAKKAIEIPENVLMQVRFNSKTTTYTKLAEEADEDGLDEDAKHFVMAAAVPIVRKDNHLFRIYKNGTYSLNIEIETPDFNPAREAFRNEFNRNEWELGRISIDNETITAFDTSGQVIFSDDNSNNPFFDRLVDKIMSDDDFASKVNIGNGLFTVSAGAENFLDPKLKPFFVGPNANTSSFDGFIIIEENVEDKMNHWGNINIPSPEITSLKPRNGMLKAKASTIQEYSLDDTQQMINDTVSKWNAGKNTADIHVYKAIDTVSNALAAEVTYAGNEQVLGLTFYEVNDDEQKTIKTAYTEDYETNPVYDLDMVNVESVEYSDVQIINTKKNNTDEN